MYTSWWDDLIKHRKTYADLIGLGHHYLSDIHPTDRPDLINAAIMKSIRDYDPTMGTTATTWFVTKLRGERSAYRRDRHRFFVHVEGEHTVVDSFLSSQDNLFACGVANSGITRLEEPSETLPNTVRLFRLMKRAGIKRSDRKLLWIYHVRGVVGDALANCFGITRQAISLRLQRIEDRLKMVREMVA